MKQPKIVLLIFVSGKIVLTGAKVKIQLPFPVLVKISVVFFFFKYNFITKNQVPLFPPSKTPQNSSSPILRRNSLIGPCYLIFVFSSLNTKFSKNVLPNRLKLTNN